MNRDIMVIDDGPRRVGEREYEKLLEMSQDQNYDKKSHAHCWTSKNPPRGKKAHARCCLCEEVAPPESYFRKKLIKEWRKSFQEFEQIIKDKLL